MEGLVIDQFDYAKHFNSFTHIKLNKKFEHQNLL